MLQRRWREFVLFLVNHIFCGTRFFSIKRALLNSCSGIKIGDGSKIVTIHMSNCSEIQIGKDCWIGEHFSVYGDGGIQIGDRCDFGPDVALLTGSHEIGDASRRAGNGKLMTVAIGDGCWVGARATIIGTIRVENSCVIGAASLVNKSFSENKLIAGVPAKCIRDL